MTRALRARRDPAWTADGYVSDRWLPISPVTGRLDAFTWTEPLTQIGSTGEVIEAAEEAAAPAVAPAAPIAEEQPPQAPPPAAPAAAEPPRRSAPAPAAASTEKIIPLLHAPDDPGPEGEAEPASEPPPGRNLDWLRGLLK